jgi:hypothetical protein
VAAYLDLAENNALRGIVMTMQEWQQFLNNFYIIKLSHTVR